MPVKSGTFGTFGTFTYIFPGRSVFAEKIKVALLALRLALLALLMALLRFKVALLTPKPPKTCRKTLNS